MLLLLVAAIVALHGFGILFGDIVCLQNLASQNIGAIFVSGHRQQFCETELGRHHLGMVLISQFRPHLQCRLVQPTRFGIHVVAIQMSGDGDAGLSGRTDDIGT